MERIKTQYRNLISQTSMYRTGKGYGPKAVKKKLKIVNAMINNQRYHQAVVIMDQVENILQTVDSSTKKVVLDVSNSWATLGVWTQLMHLTEPAFFNGFDTPVRCTYCKSQTGYLFVTSHPSFFEACGDKPENFVVSCVQHSFKAHMTWVFMRCRGARSVCRNNHVEAAISNVERGIVLLRDKIESKYSRNINWPRIPKLPKLGQTRVEERVFDAA